MQNEITESFLPSLFDRVPSLEDLDAVAAWWYGEVDQPDSRRIVNVLERTRDINGDLLSVPPESLYVTGKRLFEEVAFCDIDQGVEKVIAFMWKLRDDVRRDLHDKKLKRRLRRLFDNRVQGVRYRLGDLQRDVEFIQGLFQGSGVSLTYPRLAGAWAVLMLVRIRGYHSFSTGPGEVRVELEARTRDVAALAGEAHDNHINDRLGELTTFCVGIKPGGS